MSANKPAVGCGVPRTCTSREKIVDRFQPFHWRPTRHSYPRRARSALGVDIVLTLDVCLYVCMYVSALERKRLIGMT